ncbi:MAG: twin-arginine translocase subunit TatC [Deltaproteobacteria bacterium]|nr:twin-arginine translocase subunit TatC [Deltaproteobacteria bacterium]
MTEPGTDSEARLPLTEHLDELRKRLIRSLIAMGLGTALCYTRAEVLYQLLLAPLTGRLPGDSRLIFTELTEAFLTYFKLSLWGGFILASPVIFYQAWRFVSPGLFQKERKILFLFTGCSTAAFLSGMAFGYYLAVPSIFSFFLAFGGTTIVPMPSMKEALSLTLRILLMFGVMFEVPLVMALAGWVGIVTPELLRRGRKVAIITVFVVGAVLSPPDVLSQIFVAIPVYLLYEVGILLCALGTRRHKR